MHDQSAPAPTSNRYTDSGFDDSRSGALLRARPRHLCRLRPGRPGDAHSRVSDGVKLLRSTASTSQHPSSRLSDRLPVACLCLDPLSALLWNTGRPPDWSALSTDSSLCRTQRRDWYSVSVDLTTSQMHSSVSIGCECLKGLFSRSPCRLIVLSMAMPLSTYTAVHTDRRHPVSTKTAVFFIRRSTRSCCQTAYCWTSRLPCRQRSHMERPTGRCHLSTISAHLQKTTKTVSVSTFLV